MSRSLQRSFAVVLVLYLPAESSAVLAAGVGLPALALLVLVVLLHLRTLARAATARLDRSDLVALGVAAACGLLLTVLLQTTVRDASYTSTAPLLLAAVFLLRRRSAAVLLVIVVGAHLATRTLVPVGPGVGVALAETAFLVAVGVAGAELTRALRTAARRADGARSSALRARSAQDASVGEEEARREVQRVLHDEVVVALRAVSLYPAYPDPIGVRRAAVSALSALDRAQVVQAPTSLRGPLHAVLGASPVAVHTLAPDEAVLAATLPAGVVESLCAATAEALRNVGRHAGVPDARVEVLPEGSSGVLVRVSDDGVGFDPTTARGFGLEQSVVQRMASVGGTAAISSSRDGGSTVELAWVPADEGLRPVPPAAARHWREVVAAVGDVRRPLLVVSVPFLALYLGSALAVAPGGPHPVWQIVIALSLTVLGGATLRRAGRAPLTTRWTAALLVLVTAATTASLVLMPDGGLVGPGSWSLGLGTVVLLAVGVLRRPVEMLMFTVVQLVVLTVLAARDPVLGGLEPLVPTLLTHPVAAAFTVSFAVFLRRAGAAVIGETEAALDASVELAARARREQVRRWRTASLAAEVLPFLQAVAEEQVDLLDPAVTTRAGELTAAVRDELTLGGPVGADLRGALEKARGRGCSVRVMSDPDADLLRSPLPQDLLRVGLVGHGEATLVVLSVFEPPRSEAHLVVVPGGDVQRLDAVRALTAARGGSAHDDGHSLVATVPLRSAVDGVGRGDSAPAGSDERPTAAHGALCRSIGG